MTTRLWMDFSARRGTGVRICTGNRAIPVRRKFFQRTGGSQAAGRCSTAGVLIQSQVYWGKSSTDCFSPATTLTDSGVTLPVPLTVMM